MFSFFHRTKTIHVDAFTTDLTIHKLTPISKATKAIPDWWKDLPSFGHGNIDNNPSITGTNMKRCYGFTELFKRGFVIPNWADIHFRIGKDGAGSFSTKNLPLFHDSYQHEGAFQNHYVIKHVSPWILREKTGMPFMLFACEWNIYDRPFRILPGVPEYTLSGSSNVFFVFEKKEEPYEMFIETGLPLVHVIPLSQDNVKVHNHLVTQQEYEKQRYKITYHLPYQTLLRMKKDAGEHV